MAGKTLYDKLWESHVIRTYDQAVLAEMAEHRRVTSMALQVANMKL